MKWAAIGAALLLPLSAHAHDGMVHKDQAEAAAHAAAPEGLALPFDLGGPFTLTDQHGNSRTQADPDGHLQLLFFGYAQCREICSVALPQMAEITTGLSGRGIAITPVLITIDPARDTPQAMGAALTRLHPSFVGLTGDDAALAKAKALFSVDSAFQFDAPNAGPVYSHGSFLYLLDGRGKFLTVLPPILSTDRMMDIIAAHADGA